MSLFKARCWCTMIAILLGTSASTKRKLGTSASAQEQAKKAKRGSEELDNEDVTKDSEDDAENGD